MGEIYFFQKTRKIMRMYENYAYENYVHGTVLRISKLETPNHLLQAMTYITEIFLDYFQK